MTDNFVTFFIKTTSIFWGPRDSKFCTNLSLLEMANSLKRSHTAASDAGYIVGLGQIMVDSMRGSYNDCAAPVAAASVEQFERHRTFNWQVKGSDSSLYDITVSEPYNWSDYPCKTELMVSCSCPDGVRQAEANRRNRLETEPLYCKHAHKCLSDVVDHDIQQVPETKRNSLGGRGGGGKSFEEKLYDYNAEVGAMIMFETRAKTSRGGPCKVSVTPPYSPPKERH